MKDVYISSKASIREHPSLKVMHVTHILIFALLLWRVRNTIFSLARNKIKHAILYFTNTSVLIGQFDLMKSYGYIGIFYYKVTTILISNFPSADNKVVNFTKISFWHFIIKIILNSTQYNNSHYIITYFKYDFLNTIRKLLSIW